MIFRSQRHRGTERAASNFRHSRESGNLVAVGAGWVPAFAGMTKEKGILCASAPLRAPNYSVFEFSA